MREFIDSFCQLGFTSDPKRTATLWGALCNHMVDWLLDKNRVLDLGAIRLAAVPFRADWKNIFLAKWIIRCRRDIRLMFRSIGHGGYQVQKELEHPMYLAATGDPMYCLRHVEVIHAKDWWRQVGRIERRRAQRQDYWNEIQQLMVHYLEYATKSLLAHIHEVVSKVPFTRSKDAVRRPGVPEKWSPARNLHVEMSLGDKICAISVRDEEATGDGEPFDLVGQEEIVSEVRPV
jgi:hypothetical protein